MAQDTQLMVTNRWTGPHGELDNKEPGNETKVTVMEEEGTSGQYSSNVTFNTVHVGDSGSYSCEANVSHRASPFVHKGVKKSVATISVQGTITTWLYVAISFAVLATCVLTLLNSSECDSISDPQHNSSS